MKKFKKWEEAFKAKGLDPKVLPDAKVFGKAVVAAYILPVVIEFANDGWKPDYTDHNQDKWELWVRVIADKENPSGCGLSLDVVACWDTGTGVGVRLCFESEETARYTFNHPALKELWEDFYLGR
jgi:hypothetical protein